MWKTPKFGCFFIFPISFGSENFRRGTCRQFPDVDEVTTPGCDLDYIRSFPLKDENLHPSETNMTKETQTVSRIYVLKKKTVFFPVVMFVFRGVAWIFQTKKGDRSSC